MLDNEKDILAEYSKEFDYDSLDSSSDKKTDSSIYYDKDSEKYSKKFLIVLLIIYLFFFTSRLTIPKKITPEGLVTVINQEYSYSAEKRFYKILSADYDEEKMLLEISFEMKNQAYDNVNDFYYVFSTNGGNYKKAVLKEIINEKLITVIRIENLKPFREFELYFAPKLSKDISQISADDTAYIVLNKYNLSYNPIDESKKTEDYLLERISLSYKNYTEDLKSLEKEYQDFDVTITALKKENSDLEANMEYMTHQEITTADETIKYNLEKIKELEKKKIEKNEQIENKKKDINSTEKILEKLKNSKS